MRCVTDPRRRLLFLHPEIEGGCYFNGDAYGEWKWTNGSGKRGTSVSIAFDVTVGDSYQLRDEGSLYSIDTSRDTGVPLTTTISGTEQIIVKPITKGFYITSASGYVYNGISKS